MYVCVSVCVFVCLLPSCLQLLITIAFKSTTKVHSLQIDGPTDGRAPKGVKLFVNCKSIGFDDAEGRPAEQVLTISMYMYVCIYIYI